jgi:hypothetical protein
MTPLPARALKSTAAVKTPMGGTVFRRIWEKQGCPSSIGGARDVENPPHGGAVQGDIDDAWPAAESQAE